MNPDKIQKLTALVNSSEVLTAQEKSEWLNLVGLMNDKQMAELEEILAAQKSPTAAVPATPPLSHISNLPPGVVRQAPVAVRAPGPAGGVVAAPKPSPVSQPSQSAPAPPPGIKPVKLDSLESVQQLSAPVMRATGFKNIIAQLSDLVEQFSYFYVLSAFEQSALYRSYIQTGAILLRQTALQPPQSILTKEEFEQVADSLRSIQFS